MILPTAQISAPGLAEEQILVERAWLEGFSQAAESLDWTKWEEWWTNDVSHSDGFLQFGNLPRVQGKDAIASFHAQMFAPFESLQHNFTRYSFDLPLGLIYQTSTVIFRVKDDPEERDIQVPGMAVIHKKIGEKHATGCEMYLDSSPVMSVVQEVLKRKIVRS
ncbi:unnamed protein product [Rhizoctonia solani]|uniref:SnoaL-like domain-containing protein n=1 Tax=Rhizoctonia solani TaxID=456999 RepID=A0A8H3A0H1_9AGAM|nr:unnamed protein product [Rhizoctonia solani]CAE6418526.1 unnamed protein product [Rhizoctonia solani]